MDNENCRVIEINGIKMEIDMRHAKVATVDHLRVGDRVKVLRKEYSGYVVYPGTIIGFVPFAKLPTITVAYIQRDYKETALKFLHFNAESKDVEVVKATDDDHLTIDKAHVVQQMEAEIQKHEAAVDEAKRKLAYFRENFRAYWQVVEAPRGEVWGSDVNPKPTDAF